MVNSQSRYVSQLTKDSLAIVLAGGKGSRLHELTTYRAKPSLHFGGKFRLIDFPLSNCINSGIRKVGVLTQYKSHSLIRHLITGWGHFNRDLGEFVDLLPASMQTSSNWYQGTADAFYQNLDYIRAENPRYVVVLAGDHVYRMDYGAVLAEHVENDADLTVACLEVPVEEAANALGVMTEDNNGRITAFKEKPEHPEPIPGKPSHCLASMGIYVFNTSALFELLVDDAKHISSSHDFGKDIIPDAINSHRVFGYHFRNEETGEQAYWRDVGTIDSFWQANMELVEPSPKLNLYDQNWPIWTYQKQSPPAKFVFNDDGRRGYAVDSMVSGGCIISGSKIDRSLLFSDVRIHSYCDIKQSVILPKAEVGRHVRIQKAVIDSHCKIPAGMEIGFDAVQDLANGFRLSPQGIVLVTPDMLSKPSMCMINTPQTKAAQQRKSEQKIESVENVTEFTARKKVNQNV